LPDGFAIGYPETMMRRLLFIAIALSVSACRQAAPVFDRSATVNAGVNIVPAPILASEKIFPDTTQPADASTANLVQVISQSQQHHAKILRALQVAGMIHDLQAVGPYTLLLPTDEGFDKFPPGLFERLLLPEHRDRLLTLLRYSIISGRIGLKTMLDTNGQVLTLAGKRVVIKGIDGKLMVNDVNVIRADNSASNGIIYWLDGVLVPPE
jgi:uncharacterized surface protein with fasciclin (FAS1) repeats